MLRLLLVTVAATAAPVSPVAMLEAAVPDGFEFASEPPVELDFEEYAELAHDAVEHVDTESEAARQMTAAVDVWTAGADDILLREVTRWQDETDAAAYVEQAAVIGLEQDFDVTDTPVEGGVAFASASAGLWTRTATWQQGRFAVTVEHFALADDGGVVLQQTAESLREVIGQSTGAEPTDAELAPSAEGEPGDDESVDADGEGAPIVSTLLGVAAIALSVVLIAQFLRRRPR